MLSIRPLRPEEYRNSMQNSSFEKWGDSHGENSCSTRGTYGEPEGIRVLPMERWGVHGDRWEYPGSPHCYGR